MFLALMLNLNGILYFACIFLIPNFLDVPGPFSMLRKNVTTFWNIFLISTFEKESNIFITLHKARYVYKKSLSKNSFVFLFWSDHLFFLFYVLLQLGNVIWNGRLHYDGSKSRQPVWYFKPARVPYCVGQKRLWKKRIVKIHFFS